MSLPIICPSCHLKFPVESGITHAAAHAAIANAIKLPAPLGSLIIRYVGLFSPQSRAINMDRLANILNELNDEISTGKVKHQNRTYPAPIQVWRIALEEILMKRDKWTLPLKTHGLLISLVAQFAVGRAATEEDKIEKQRRHRIDDKPEEVGRNTAEIMADINHFKRMIESMPEGIDKENTLKTIDKLNDELEGVIHD